MNLSKAITALYTIPVIALVVYAVFKLVMGMQVVTDALSGVDLTGTL